MPNCPNLIGFAIAFFAFAILSGCSKKNMPKPDNGMSITSISETSGKPADTLIITGNGFHTDGGNTVTFNGIKSTIISVTKTQIAVIVPPDAQSGNISIKTGDDTVLGPVFTLIRAVKTPVIIVALSVTAGREATPVTITGSGFSANPSQDYVFFNGTRATVTSATATELQTSFPKGATSGLVLVYVNGVIGIGPEFTLLN